MENDDIQILRQSINLKSVYQESSDHLDENRDGLNLVKNQEIFNSQQNVGQNCESPIRNEHKTSRNVSDEKNRENEITARQMVNLTPLNLKMDSGTLIKDSSISIKQDQNFNYPSFRKGA